MHRLLLAALFLAFASVPVSSACWAARDPAGFAESCPVIIRGPIVEITEGEKGAERADDIAYIRVDELIRNDVKDVAIKVGDKFPVRMVSKNNRLRSSTDLNYPLKTEAIWLIVLTTKGEFRIDTHPVQKQATADREKLKLTSRRVEKVRKIGENQDDRKTKAELIAELKKEEERRAKATAEYDARNKLLRDITVSLVEAKKIDNEGTRSLGEAPADVRRDVFQLTPWAGGLEGNRLVDVAEYVLQHDPDANVRCFAMIRLGYAKRANEPLAERAKEVLAAALTDPNADVRMYSCQALWQRQAKEHAAAVAKLLRDPDANVRSMAVHTVARLGYKKALPAVLDVYERDGKDAKQTLMFIDAMARLDEPKRMFEMARKVLKDGSERPDLVFSTLAPSKSRDVIPFLMENLVSELNRNVKSLKDDATSRADFYEDFCKQLEKRAGKSLGADPIAWLGWWASARTDFGAPELKVDRAAVKTAYEQYQKLHAERKK